MKCKTSAAVVAQYANVPKLQQRYTDIVSRTWVRVRVRVRVRVTLTLSLGRGLLG